MAIDVTTGRGKTTTEVKIQGKTKVASVKVGRPVKRVSSTASGHINSLGGVNLGGVTDGSVLVYDEDLSTFEATLDLDKQNLNGGHY